MDDQSYFILWKRKNLIASKMFKYKTASNFYTPLPYDRNPDKMMIYAHEMWEVITVLTR